MEPQNQDATVQLATATAKITVQEEKITSLTSQLDTASKEVIEKERDRAALAVKLTDAEAQLSTAKLSVDGLNHRIEDLTERNKQLEAERTELKAKLSTQENESTSSKVMTLCRAAIKEGVPPAQIQAFGDYEKDPVGMLKLSFGGSVDTLAKVLKALPRDAALAAAHSGRTAPSETGDDSSVSPDIAAELRKRGLNPAFANVDNTDQLAALSAKK